MNREGKRGCFTDDAFFRWGIGGGNRGTEESKEDKKVGMERGDDAFHAKEDDREGK